MRRWSLRISSQLRLRLRRRIGLSTKIHWKFSSSFSSSPFERRLASYKCQIMKSFVVFLLFGASPVRNFQTFIGKEFSILSHTPLWSCFSVSVVFGQQTYPLLTPCGIGYKHLNLHFYFSHFSHLMLILRTFLRQYLNQTVNQCVDCPRGSVLPLFDWALVNVKKDIYLFAFIFSYQCPKNSLAPVACDSGCVPIECCRNRSFTHELHLFRSRQLLRSESLCWNVFTMLGRVCE